MAKIVKIIGSVTKKLELTGTCFTNVYDDSGQLISKTVGVGSKNKSSKYKTMKTYYYMGKPESVVLRNGRLVEAYAKKIIKYKRLIRTEWQKIVFSSPS